ncbi:MAG: hypothetical protein KC561_17360, partial [Myxococcales bacterium]|nr:hypothetical protein [Myxococcales bacterium]
VAEEVAEEIAESDTTDATGHDVLPDLPADDEAPAFRSLRVRVAGPGGIEADMNGSNPELILPSSASAEFVVFARDNVDRAEDLTVLVIDADTSDAVEGQSADFSGGLWTVTATVEPGHSYGVTLADRRGNQIVSAHQLVMLSAFEALVDSWTFRTYGTAEVYQETAFLDLEDDGTWCMSFRNDGTADTGAGGTWSVADGLFRTEVRHQLPCDEDWTGEWDSIEEIRVAEYFVDTSYFSRDPYFRKTGSVGSNNLNGSWERTTEYYRAGSVEVPLESQTETLSFDGSTFSYSRRGTLHQEGDSVYEDTAAGSYRVIVNTDYQDDFGDFLELTYTLENGEEIAPRVTLDFFEPFSGRLFISPFIRDNE